jgi:putative membrane protein
MAEPVFRRLHPLTIFVELARVIGRFIFLFLILLFTPGSSSDWAYEAFSGFIVVAAIARYLSTSFAVHDGHLLIKYGIINRVQRTIPLSKIQNISIQKNLIHRIFGLVDLKIETAAGAEAEASLSALSIAEADALKVELTQGVHKEIGLESMPEATRGRTVYKISSKELFLAGATENRALAILGALFGGSFIFQERLEGFVKGAMPSIEGSWVPIAVIGIVFLLFGWIASIVSAVFSYGNFEVTLEGGKLRRHYGLVNQIESVVPLPRVQLVRTTETLFQRALHLCKLFVETAGHFQKEDLGGSSLVCPLLEADRLQGIVMTVLPGRPIDAVRWQRVSPWTIRTHAQLSMWVYTAMAAIAAAFFGWVAFYALIPAAAWAVFTAWVRYRTTGYDNKPSFLAARHGVFSRRTMYVPVEKIQSTMLRQSPLQRRLGLSTVAFNTAAIGTGGSGSVVDLRNDDAVSLARSLHRRSADSVRMTGEVL